MKTSTDVVIIGGGIMGCAIAYYLRKSDVDVIVLDQGEIGAQASSAAAGLLAPPSAARCRTSNSHHERGGNRSARSAPTRHPHCRDR